QPLFRSGLTQDQCPIHARRPHLFQSAEFCNSSITASKATKFANPFCTSSESSRASISCTTLRAPSTSTSTFIEGTKLVAADSYSIPASCRAVLTATTSVGSDKTSNTSPRSSISSAPASSTAASTSSSVKSALGTITTPRREKR